MEETPFSERPQDLQTAIPRLTRLLTEAQLDWNEIHASLRMIDSRNFLAFLCLNLGLKFTSMEKALARLQEQTPDITERCANLCAILLNFEQNEEPAAHRRPDRNSLFPLRRQEYPFLGSSNQFTQDALEEEEDADMRLFAPLSHPMRHAELEDGMADAIKMSTSPQRLLDALKDSGTKWEDVLEAFLECEDQGLARFVCLNMGVQVAENANMEDMVYQLIAHASTLEDAKTCRTALHDIVMSFIDPSHTPEEPAVTQLQPETTHTETAPIVPTTIPQEPEEDEDATMLFASAAPQPALRREKRDEEPALPPAVAVAQRQPADGTLPSELTLSLNALSALVKERLLYLPTATESCKKYLNSTMPLLKRRLVFPENIIMANRLLAIRDIVIPLLRDCSNADMQTLQDHERVLTAAIDKLMPHSAATTTDSVL